jgi:hypothetical protein
MIAFFTLLFALAFAFTATARHMLFLRGAAIPIHAHSRTVGGIAFGTDVHAALFTASAAAVRPLLACRTRLHIRHTDSIFHVIARLASLIYGATL